MTVSVSAYLDHNATAPLCPEARAAWLDAAGSFAHNPSGLHAGATRARDLLERCRDSLAGLLGCDDVRRIEDANADEGVRWLFSFLSADRRRSYCLYEAPSPDVILAAASRAGIPADVVVEVDRISADMYV